MVFSALQNKLIISVQADAGDPLDDPFILAAIARSVVQGGAAGVRAGGPENIRAIRRAVDVPLIGLYKRPYPDSPVYITPTMREARQVAEAGCDVLALDATGQARPGGESLEVYFKMLRAEISVPLLADVSTLDEGLRAVDLGADIVATSLAGYTAYSRQLEGPDFQLIADLAARVSVPVIAEGRMRGPEDVRRALEVGAFAVVAGSMITRPGVITAHFVAGIP
jgi:N-acylglucosamine-6-phosphate 2-epimerase